ncbi:hypothetical protein GIB67_031400 [Kingdonia uniflora]|uniref:Uncharacterized protein n=1 Tax=Kingdonia uniflora TaxID=39325 RepID=A0A7J7MBE5_9MAGN|nr:hypothetical protein GIB67_031400 [Kingdonia uniflora]
MFCILLITIFLVRAERNLQSPARRFVLQAQLIWSMELMFKLKESGLDVQSITSIHYLKDDISIANTGVVDRRCLPQSFRICLALLMKILIMMYFQNVFGKDKSGYIMGFGDMSSAELESTLPIRMKLANEKVTNTNLQSQLKSLGEQLVFKANA